MVKDQLPNPKSRPQIPVEEGFRRPAWKGSPSWKGRGEDRSLQRPAEHLEVPGAPLRMLGAPRDTRHTWRCELTPKPPPNKPEDAESL